MKPFYVLLGASALFLFVIKLFTGIWNFQTAGVIGMSMMLLFTAIGHFAFTKGMTMMLPDIIPIKKIVIVITGFIEIISAIFLVIPLMQISTAWFLILFFISLLPFNIYAAIHHVNYEKGTYDGKGISYLWVRIPLQVLFIGWTYFFAIYLQ